MLNRLGLMAILLIVAVTAVRADEPMTCDQFRSALAKAISDAGDRVAQPRLDEVAYRRDDGSMVRYALKGIAAMGGNLRCKTADRIEAFDADVEVDRGEGAIRVHRLTALAAAAACAVAPKMTPAACAAVAGKLANGATKKFARAYVRGEEIPADFQKTTLPSGFELEFDAGPGTLSFILVPPIK